MEKSLYHVVEFYYDPDDYVAEIYRGMYSTIPENFQFLTGYPIVIKAFPVIIDQETYFKISDEAKVILATPKYYSENWD